MKLIRGRKNNQSTTKPKPVYRLHNHCFKFMVDNKFCQSFEELISRKKGKKYQQMLVYTRLDLFSIHQ